MKDDSTRAFAKTLRKDMSLPEMLIWRRLKRREPGEPVFRRQLPVGSYVLNFYCMRARLCIEVDGIAHGMNGRGERDEVRNRWLEVKGLMVMRIPAVDMLRDPDDMADSISRLARSRLSLFRTPPFGGGGGLER